MVFTGRVGDGGITQNQQTAPQAVGSKRNIKRIINIIGAAGEDDRVVFGTVGENLSSSADAQETGVYAGSELSFNNSTGIDCQNAAIFQKSSLRSEYSYNR